MSVHYDRVDENGHLTGATMEAVRFAWVEKHLNDGVSVEFMGTMIAKYVFV